VFAALHSLLAAAAPPARGAPTSDLIPATLVGFAATAGMLWLASAHRAGRTQLVNRVASGASRLTGLPGWSALPILVCSAALITAAFGFYWDVGIHIDDGRDPGPFANNSHYLILLGLAGITLAGFLSVILGTDRKVPSSLRLAGVDVPLGGAVMLLCGGIALMTFPMDDVWHRLFGQDVTLWSPTHVLMVGGGSLATLGLWMLLVEGRRARATDPDAGRAPRALRVREIIATGSFLAGLSTLQLEFGYGVPQFQLVFHPILIMLAAGIALVAARVRLGRGGALLAAVTYLLPMAVATAIIGPGLGHTTLHFPLYLAEAALVELVAFRIPRERPVLLGAVSGVAIGTVGLAAEWGWSHVWMPIPWPSSMLIETIALATPAAVAAGVLGGLIGRAVGGSSVQTERIPTWVPALAGIIAVLVIAIPMPRTAGKHIDAAVTLQQVQAGGQRATREVIPTVRLTPVNAAHGARWFYVMAWQGGGSVREKLREIAPGTYRADGPVPVSGDWKALVRLQKGTAVTAMPIYMPNDPAIPAKEIPARASFERPFVLDHQLMQREAVGGAAWLQGVAYIVLLLVAIGWVAALALALKRMDRTSRAPARPDARSGMGGAIGSPRGGGDPQPV
jgi:hypothetical protein